MKRRPRVVERPWGHYREYARNEPCTVWLVEMKPGEAGSLQSHRCFDELWLMLDEGAVVQVGDEVLHPRPYDEILIRRGTKHRLSCREADAPVRMFEVMLGEVSDDDKVRYEDEYGRADSPAQAAETESQAPPAMSGTHSVLCIGDMVADIFAAPVPRLPEPGEMLPTDRVAVFPGGNALNTAVALRRLGAQVAIVGSVGHDALGDLLLAQLEATGLDLRGVRREQGASTAATVIYRAEGEDRRYIHALGASGDFTGEDIPEGLVPRNGVVFIGGYLKLAHWSDRALVATLQRARQRNCQVVLNVSIPREGDVDLGRCMRLLPRVDVFVPNQDEAHLLTGEMMPGAQTRALREAGTNWVIITRGERGLYADDGSRVIDMGAFSVPLVDPSGCGDCFTAGLIMGLLQRWDPLETLKFASGVGALGVTALGCTSGVPALAEAVRFVEEHDIEVTVARPAEP